MGSPRCASLTDRRSAGWDGVSRREPAFADGSHEWLLTAAAGGYATPGSLTWVDFDGDWGVDDFGVSGGGPDVVRIPDEAAAGEWELCNLGGEQEPCTTVQVGGPPVPADVLQVAVMADPEPRERFDIVFPGEPSRPTAWQMLRPEQLGGRTGYVLYPVVAHSAPRWQPAQEVRVFTSDALVGPGPDVLVVPEEAEPGSWLVCPPFEADSERCATLEESEPG